MTFIGLNKCDCTTRCLSCDLYMAVGVMYFDWTIVHDEETFVTWYCSDGCFRKAWLQERVYKNLERTRLDQELGC